MHRWSCYQTFDPLATFIRANSFGIFPKNPSKLKTPPLTPQSILEFKTRMKRYGYANNMVLVYGSHLITLGNPDRFVFNHSLRFSVMTKHFSQRKAGKIFWMSFGWLAEVRGDGFGVVRFSVSFFFFSFSTFVHLFVFHSQSPGSALDAMPTESYITWIADCINWAHKATRTVKTVLENRVQPCRCPFAQGWYCWDRKEMSLAPSFPI